MHGNVHRNQTALAEGRPILIHWTNWPLKQWLVPRHKVLNKDCSVDRENIPEATRRLQSRPRSCLMYSRHRATTTSRIFALPSKEMSMNIPLVDGLFVYRKLGPTNQGSGDPQPRHLAECLPTAGKDIMSHSPWQAGGVAPLSSSLVRRLTPHPSEQP